MVIVDHAGVPLLGGGYVGVDVFFVLSGFLITGLLLREQEVSGRISITAFYARRVRRILPASTLVLLATLIGSYIYLGPAHAGRIAVDAQWSAVFASNLRFIEQGTNYLASQLPPSPLQHYWSLAVEEQFYAVWPLALIVIAAVAKGRTLRRKLGNVLLIVIIASLSWSIIQTADNGAVAYFSPLTRAWELATGALLAVSIPALLRLPRRLGAPMSLLGIAAIVAGGLLFTAYTPFPGYAVALPVIGAALVVAGGTVSPGEGAEILLSIPLLQWLGKLSYSLYLWHWPVLVIAREYLNRALSPGETVLLCALALVLSCLTSWIVENPVRNSRWLKRRSPLISIAIGAGLVIASLGIAAGAGMWLSPPAPAPQPAPPVVFPNG